MAVLPPFPLSPPKGGAQAFLFVPFFVYILASQRTGTLYLGCLPRIAGFQPALGRLGQEPAGSRRYEKWRRAWKLELIERFNPTWRDLIEDFN